VSPRSQAASPVPDTSPEVGIEGGSEVELLIDATWAVAARTGSIEPGVREILQESGLSTKAFYRHFQSKDDLLLVALDQACNVLVEYLEYRMARVEDPMDKIEEWIDGCLRQAKNPSAARRILPWTLGFGRIATKFPQRLQHTQDAMKLVLEREIRTAVASGAAHSPDPAGDAQIIFAFTGNTVQRYLVNGTTPDAGVSKELADFARRALSVPRPDEGVVNAQ
jgi:AcrR family transcriptional regulator